jgi:hypothetical protein
MLRILYSECIKFDFLSYNLPWVPSLISLDSELVILNYLPVHDLQILSTHQELFFAHISEMRTKSVFVLCSIYVNNWFENEIMYHECQRILQNVKARIWEMYLLYPLVYLMTVSVFRSQSQRSSGLKHEPFSPARKMGSWVRIPVEAWMSVCVCSVCR